MRDEKEISLDVARGLELRGEIEARTSELKEIEIRLKQDGLDRPDEHQPLADADREGRQWLAGGIVPVVFTADLLMKKFPAKSKADARIRPLAGEHFARFFVPSKELVTTEKSGKKFRVLADSMLGKEAPAFIAACRQLDRQGLPKSAVKILWGEDESEGEE